MEEAQLQQNSQATVLMNTEKQKALLTLQHGAGAYLHAVLAFTQHLIKYR